MFFNLECNCKSNTKVNVIYAYGGKCQKFCIVDKIECKFCDDCYVGNNQNTLKMNGTTLPICGPKGTLQQESRLFCCPLHLRFPPETNPTIMSQDYLF